MKTAVARYGIGSLLLILLAAIFSLHEEWPLLGPAVALVLGAVAALEYLKLVAHTLPRGFARVTGVLILLVSVGAVWMAARYEPAESDVFLALLLPAMIFVASMVLIAIRREQPVAPGDFGAVLHVGGLTAFTLLPVAALAATMTLGASGIAFAAVVVLGSKGNDIGGFIGGTLLGRHKLCPGVSPNKTVEGALSGVLLGVGTTLFLARSLPELEAPLAGSRAIILGLALALATQTGDLIESALKRSVAAKDSGHVLPAFGGVLDLIDSLIFSAPLGYTLARAWLN